MARRIVVVGGGFGGLHVVQGLRREDVEITLVSRTNHTLFQPLLYQVATGSLDEDEVATPIRRVLRRQRNVRFVMAEVDRIDPAAKTVHARTEGAEQTFPYDTLVVAPGVVYNYFGQETAWRPFAPSLKTIADAEEIRRRALLSFERAENEPDPAARAALLNYVLVGGGPTGVEMAGALAELLKESLSRELTMVRPEEVSIVLVEASPRILGQFPEALAAASARRLERLGVTLRLDARVTAIDGDGVRLGEERIPTENVIWTAGVKGVPLLATLGVPLDRAGRVPVTDRLEVEGLPGVYVLGDAAAIPGPDGHPLPGVAQVAMQGGDYVARAIRASLAGREAPGPFRYWDKGNMAVVGRAFAIADLHRVRLKGIVAWFAWLFIHILYLTSFRSRLFVFWRWVWAYLFANRSAVVFDAPTPLAPVSAPQVDAGSS